MGNRDHNFSFTGRQTDDLEELFFECHSALKAVRHVCDAPENHQAPEPVLRGCAFILDGVIDTLDTVEDRIAAEARGRRLRYTRPMAAHNEDVKAFKERWGEDATSDMYAFIWKHYASQPDGEEGSSGEADDAPDA